MPEVEASPIGACSMPPRLAGETPVSEVERNCKGLAIAWTTNCSGISRPSFSCMRSKMIPTIESVEVLLRALASVTCPMIFAF